jgi:FixJ family two-component response regulator
MRANLHVSIVDDDESVRVATMKLLRLHGHAAYAFASAEEFLSSSLVGDTGCLITDVRMPGMGGLALQEYLRDEGHQIPIIFVTAYPEEKNRARALRAGALSFLGKPFDGRALIDTVDRALGRCCD